MTWGTTLYLPRNSIPWVETGVMLDQCHAYQPWVSPSHLEKWRWPGMVFLTSFQAHEVLVGGSATPLKNMKVNWDDEIPNIWENTKMATKPPTRVDIQFWETQSWG